MKGTVLTVEKMRSSLDCNSPQRDYIECDKEYSL